MNPAADATPHQPAAQPPIEPWRATLSPTRGVAVALAMTLGLRAMAWIARPIDWPAWPAARELAKALAWDVILTLGVLAVGRALLGVAQARVRALLQVALAVGVVAAVWVRWFDIGHCYMARCHWTADAFLYLDAGFSGTARDPRLIGALAGLGGSAALAIVALRLDRTRVQRRLPPGLPPRWLLLPLLLCLLPLGWVLRDAIVYRPTVDDARVVPEVNFVLQAIDFEQEPETVGAAPTLSAAFIDKLHRLGVEHPDAPLRGDWPLLRPSFHFPPLPVPQRTGVAHRPNVVLTLMESTNSLFVHGLSGRYRGLMPEVSALASQMTVVDGFRNTASPTISAMITALCSLHPAAHPRDLQPGQSVDGKAAYTCLADVLRGQGYRTVFLQGASKTVTSKEYFLRTHGFDEVLGREDLEPLYAARHPSGPWGVHDAQLVTHAKALIARLESERARDGRPYLLVMLTLDSHEPGMAADDCQLPKTASGTFAFDDAPSSDRALRLLRGYHCSDRAIGELGRFLLDPVRRDRSLWMLTADHAAFSTMIPQELYVDQRHKGDSVAVPLLIHDPLHDLPRRVDVLAGTRDLAPTLAHLLDLREAANSMTGMSIFGMRPQYPFLVGRVGERLAFAHSRDVHVELPVGLLKAKCTRGEVLMEVHGIAWTACDLQHWLTWQDQLWQAKRLFPPQMYHGADGVERKALERRQDVELPDQPPKPPKDPQPDAGHG